MLCISATLHPSAYMVIAFFRRSNKFLLPSGTASAGISGHRLIANLISDKLCFFEAIMRIPPSYLKFAQNQCY